MGMFILTHCIRCQFGVPKTRRKKKKKERKGKKGILRLVETVSLNPARLSVRPLGLTRKVGRDKYSR